MQDDPSIRGADLHLSITRPGVRRSLERALRAAVQDGRLVPGARLPSSRTLANDLDIARNTVTDVYEQLTAEGWLTSRRGSGTSVSTHQSTVDDGSDQPTTPAVARARTPRYDFTPGAPNVVAFPRHAWLKASGIALTDAAHDAFGYGDVRGRPELRDALADYLGRVRAVRATGERIVITSGTVNGFSMLCAALKARGASTIALEAVGWPRMVRVARDQGLRPVTIDVDGHGACVDELHATRADAVLLTAAHQYPTGFALSALRRRTVIDWARGTGALIIEDDYDGEFRYDRQPIGSLQDLAPDCVAYLGTTSKTLAPGIRLGWAVLPGDEVARVSAVKESTVYRTGALDQLALAQFIRSGAYDRHIRRSRLAYRRRRDRLVARCAVEAPGVAITGLAAGLHAVLALPKGTGRAGEEAIVRAADERGLGLQGLSALRLDGRDAEPGLVVGFGACPDHAFEPALDVLMDVLANSRSSRSRPA
jgi:GntR family transcriptional regulator/MocR family aminotransferase